MSSACNTIVLSKFVRQWDKFDPRHLYSPHTTFLRQSGHSFELATALCSLLIGAGYDAYVVSGYAIKDVTERIMVRVDCSVLPVEETTPPPVIEELDKKYTVTPPKDMRSKFILMLEQREADRIKKEAEEQAAADQKRFREEEERPFDELEGQRVHAWILIRSNQRNIQENFFIEPSTGIAHALDSDVYLGIESLWNHENYWLNIQNSSVSLSELSFNLNDMAKWEHLLVGEPLKWRIQPAGGMEEEESEDFWDEKHLDVPVSWSEKIEIPHEVLKRRFPEGSKTTQYKRLQLEEYAPYVCDDGLVQKITRFSDFDCTIMESVEDKFENRIDHLDRTFWDVNTNLFTEYFGAGREDGAIKHIFDKGKEGIEATRTIFFNSKARFDGLSEIQIQANKCTETYADRDDRLYYREVVYGTKKKRVSMGPTEAARRPILKIIQKFLRDESKSPFEDLAFREFNLVNREINLKYHYGKDNVTASTRTFLLPPISEIGDGMTFKPELTYGYDAQLGAKPPRQLQLYLLLEQQIKDEKEVFELIRDFENQINEFLLHRAQEMAFNKLEVSVYNKEQNQQYRIGMLEQEEKQRADKEKEVEEEVDYLSPYLARLGNLSSLTYKQALDMKYACLDDYKRLLVDRANDIQQQFEQLSHRVEEMQMWYSQNHENLTSTEEAKYFVDINSKLFLLRTLEMRLLRHKDLSSIRYEAMNTYLKNHPMLDALDK